MPTRKLWDHAIEMKEGFVPSKGVPTIKRRKKRDIWVYSETIEKVVYQTLKVVPNGTGVFCRKKG